jgi:phosphate transport system permease protein
MTAATTGMISRRSSLVYRRRRVTNTIAIGMCSAAAFAAAGVLLLILGYVLSKGAGALNVDFFTQLPKPVGEPGGGIKNSIVGSLIVVGLAAAIAIPTGIGAGIYVSEYAGTAIASVVRFTADVLTGVPSIVVGIFIYGLVVVRMGHFSALAGGCALAVIMIPIVARSSEEMLKLVPQSQREAALALGITRWRTIVNVVLPASRRGLTTGALLAVARASGETAPLLFTILGNQFLVYSVTDKPIDALPLRIYQYASGPYKDQQAQAWAAAFVLVVVVFIINLLARLLLARPSGTRS